MTCLIGDIYSTYVISQMNNDVTNTKRFVEESLDYQQDHADSDEKLPDDEDEDDVKDNIVVRGL